MTESEIDQWLSHEPSSVKEVLKQLLTLISPTPTENEAIRDVVKKLSRLCMDIARKKEIPLVDVVHVGSSSRDTHLKGDTDIDLFMRFRCHSKEEIKAFLQQVATALEKTLLINIVWKYSENPYLHFSIMEKDHTFLVDIVGIAFIQSPKDLQQSLKFGGMARTPFHSWYLEKKLNQSLKASIRLFKYWLKLKKCYGTGGITGFLAELLIIHCQGFMACLKLLTRTPMQGLYLDLEHHYSSVAEMKKRFPRDPCVVIDPIDPNRNAAGGIQGFYSKFLTRRLQREAKKTLLNPTTELNQEIQAGPGWVKINVHFKTPLVNEDERFLKMTRIARMTTSQLKTRGFQLEDVLINSKKDEIYLKFMDLHVDYFVRRGPPLDQPKDVKKFKEKNADTFEQEGRVWARVKNTPNDVISWMKKKQEYIQQVLSIKLHFEIIK